MTVTILQDHYVFASTTTAIDGRFSVKLEDGIYEMYITDGDFDYNDPLYCGILELNGNISGVSINLPESNIYSYIVTDIEDDFERGVMVDGLADIARDTPHSAASVYIEFEAVSDNNVTSSDKAAVDAGKDKIRKLSEANGQTIEFFSFYLTRYDYNGTKYEPTDLGSANTHLLTIRIPYVSTGKKNVRVYRCHNDAAEALKQNPAAGEEGFVISAATDEIIIYAKRFSVYAVGNGEPSNSSGDSSGGSSGGGGAAVKPVTGTAAAVSTAGGLQIGSDVLSASKPVQAFTDVEPGRWSKEAIDFVVTRGIFNGNGDGKFEPTAPLSRGMIAQVFYNIAGRPAVSGASAFSDRSSFLWFGDAIDWAAANGLINGMPDGSYDAAGSVTREQAAVILFRFAKAIGMDTEARAELGFSDKGSLRSYAYDAMQWAVAKGFINGDGGKLLPGEPVTREQMAAILMRFIKAVN